MFTAWWFWYGLIGIPVGYAIWWAADNADGLDEEWEYMTSNPARRVGMIITCWVLWLPFVLFVLAIRGIDLWRIWRK